MQHGSPNTSNTRYSIFLHIQHRGNKSWNTIAAWGDRYPVFCDPKERLNYDGQDNLNGKELTGFYEQNNNSASASTFFVNFFAFRLQLQREMTKF